MGKLLRKIQKIFAINSIDSGDDGTTIYGTPASTNTQYSKDVELIQNNQWEKGQYGACIAGLVPALTDHNSIYYVLSYQLKYIFQNGIPEWIGTENYYINSIVKRNNKIYVSLTGTEETPNINNDPLNDDGTNWEDYLADIQQQIDTLIAKSDVTDYVPTYQDLQDYDVSTLGDNDIIVVLSDSTHNDLVSYYRYKIRTGQTPNYEWVYIGSLSSYYSKSQTDTLLNQKVNISQGAENVNKILVVNASGNLELQNNSGGGGGIATRRFNVNVNEFISKFQQYISTSTLPLSYYSYNVYCNYTTYEDDYIEVDYLCQYNYDTAYLVLPFQAEFFDAVPIGATESSAPASNPDYTSLYFSFNPTYPPAKISLRYKFINPDKYNFVNPILSANGTPGGSSFSITAPNGTGGGNAWGLFNDRYNQTAYWQGNIAKNSLSTSNYNNLLIYNPTALKIDRIHLRSLSVNTNTECITNLEVYAGNDTSNMTKLVECSLEVPTNNFYWQIYTLNINSSNYYNYYEIRIVGGVGSSGAGFSGMSIVGNQE